jgi:hypothetical protein
MKPHNRVDRHPDARPSDRALEERERRLQAKAEQDACAVLLGEPPPGYSALDMRPAEAEAPVSAPRQRSNTFTAAARLTVALRRRFSD